MYKLPGCFIALILGHLVQQDGERQAHLTGAHTMVLTRVHGISTIVLLLSRACYTAVEGPWCYGDTDCGPLSWVSLGHCGGNRQSPIDIITAKAVLNPALGPITLSGYDKHKKLRDMKNMGKTVNVKLKDGLLLSGSGLPGVYAAKTLHFHWGNGVDQPGSEHCVDGKRYSMELHIVHTRNNMSKSAALDDPQGIAVLAFFVEGSDSAKGKTAKAWESFSKNLHRIAKKGSDTKLRGNFSLQDLIGPTDLGRYYRYSGSLTTPNCNEVVIWTVFPDPILVPSKVVAFFPLDLHTTDSFVGPHLINNFRPLQRLHNRMVEASALLKPPLVTTRASQAVVSVHGIDVLGVLPI